jgi:hypothetical protein
MEAVDESAPGSVNFWSGEPRPATYQLVGFPGV